MNHDALIEEYLAGPGLLRRAVAGMTRDQLLARPITDKWSTQEVVCHLADYEPIYADRMKRVIALKEPELLKGDPGLFAVRLAYEQRDMEEELALIEWHFCPNDLAAGGCSGKSLGRRWCSLSQTREKTKGEW